MFMVTIQRILLPFSFYRFLILYLGRLNTFVIYYPAISVYNQNIQWALMAATSPPQKCAMMALGVRSR